MSLDGTESEFEDKKIKEGTTAPSKSSKSQTSSKTTTPSKSMKTKKIQVDPESQDHAFKELKDDPAIEDFEDEKDSSRSGKLKCGNLD